MIMLAGITEIDLDVVDAIADAAVVADRPPMPPAWCASCWSVPPVVSDSAGWRVACGCGNHGPMCYAVEDAKTAWNKAQWAKYTSDAADRYVYDADATEAMRAARKKAVLRAYKGYCARNPVTIKARHWAQHRTSSCCGATYSIRRSHKQDDPVAVCRKCGKSFHVAHIVRRGVA